MENNRFEEFIRKQLQNKEPSPSLSDWDKVKSSWLKQIESFYVIIKNHLDSYIKNGVISCSFSNKNMLEEQLGPYNTTRMILSLYGNKLTFDPIGTVLIGAHGRIDLIGPRDTIKFLLVNEKSSGPIIKIIEDDSIIQPNSNPNAKNSLNLKWKILDRDTSKLKFIELTKDSLLNALMDSIDG